MSSETKLTIIDRRLKLNGERTKMIEKLIESYDREVYNPAMTRLREDCAGEGHEPTRNVGMWSICANCGDSYIGR